jgi:hypothetical protein
VSRGMIDLTGQRVVDFTGMGGTSRILLCICDCGAACPHLRSGNTKSCGGLRLRRLEQARKRTQLQAPKLTHDGACKAWQRGRGQNSRTTIYGRLGLGWPIDLAFSRNE